MTPCVFLVLLIDFNWPIRWGVALSFWQYFWKRLWIQKNGDHFPDVLLSFFNVLLRGFCLRFSFFSILGLLTTFHSSVAQFGIVKAIPFETPCWHGWFLLLFRLWFSISSLIRFFWSKYWGTFNCAQWFYCYRLWKKLWFFRKWELPCSDFHFLVRCWRELAK